MEPKYMGRCAVWVGLAPLSCDGGSVETFTAGAHVGSHFHETVECGGFNRRGCGAYSSFVDDRLFYNVRGNLEAMHRAKIASDRFDHASAFSAVPGNVALDPGIGASLFRRVGYDYGSTLTLLGLTRWANQVASSTRRRHWIGSKVALCPDKFQARPTACCAHVHLGGGNDE